MEPSRDLQYHQQGIDLDYKSFTFSMEDTDKCSINNNKSDETKESGEIEELETSCDEEETNPLLFDEEEKAEQNHGDILESCDMLDYILVVKPIPCKRWSFAFMNRFWLKIQGVNFLTNVMKKLDSDIYKLKLRKEMIMVCNHSGLKLLLDPRKVIAKAVRYDFDFNLVLTQQQKSWINPNIDIIKKSKMIVTFINDIIDNLDVSCLYKTISEEIIRIGTIDHTNHRKAERFDFEGVIERAVSNVVTQVMLGTAFDDCHVFDEWRRKILKSKSYLNLALSNFTKLNGACLNGAFDKNIESAIKLKHLRENNESDYREMLCKLIFNGFLSIKASVISSLICYLRLPESDQLLLKKEGDIFATSTDHRNTLPNLPFINAFYMEVLRVHPPIQLLHGVAKEEFILESPSGNFIVQENDVVCGCPHIAQRDPELFKDPNHFSMHRPMEELDKANYNLGGFSLDELAFDKHNYVGHHIFSSIVKTFAIIFTQCSITPMEIPVYTGRAFDRVEASDKPLRILRFSYDSTS